MTRPKYNARPVPMRVTRSYSGGLQPATQDDQIRNDYLDAIKFTTNMEVTVHTRDLLDLLKHQQQVVQSLASLEKVRRGDRTADPSEMKTLAACKASMSTMHKFLCQTMELDPLRMQPSERSSVVAMKVFQIPELAELIMLKLTPAAILQTMGTCKSLASTVGSPSIQVKLGLRSPAKGNWYSVFEVKRDVLSSGWRSHRVAELHDTVMTRIATTEKEVRRIVDTGTAKVHAAFQDQRGNLGDDGKTRVLLPKIGQRGLSMFICEPPITKMDVYLSCCMSARWGRNSTAGHRDPAGTIQNAKGLTVGDLHGATARYQAEHERCRYAAKNDHDREGRVLTTVKFEGLLQLRSDDPFVLQGYKSRDGATKGRVSLSPSPVRVPTYFSDGDVMDDSDDEPDVESEGGVDGYMA
ncbi:hypothetical protein LTS12_001064 [Elasticomyces elasticus]|nr:hypothetical protein LTS12_001064 [Elasticomyces elasticus]